MSRDQFHWFMSAQSHAVLRLQGVCKGYKDRRLCNALVYCHETGTILFIATMYFVYINSMLEAGMYQGVSAKTENDPKCVVLGWRCIPSSHRWLLV